MLCVQRSREFRRIGFTTSHWCILAYLHAFSSVPECFKRPDKLIFAWVSPCPGAGSPGGEKCRWEQSDAAKGCEALLEHPCFMSTDSLRSDWIYSCVQLCIPHFIPRYCTQASGWVFPIDGLSISNGHFFCLLCRQKLFSHLLLFFSQIATEFLMFVCTLADWDISWCVVRHAYRILPSSTSLSLPYHLPCYLVFETSLSALLKPVSKYLHFMKVSSFCPATFPCLLSSCAMRQHDVNFFFPGHCVASLQITW